MRLSVRKVVKYSTFLTIILLLNVWISYNVNIWTFNNLNDRGKVAESLDTRRDVGNGGAWPSPPNGAEGAVPGQEFFGVGGLGEVFRRQRSAKSVSVSYEGNNWRNAVGYKRGTDRDESLVASQQNKNLMFQKNGSLQVSVNRQAKPGAVSNKSGARARLPNQLRETELSDVFVSVKTTLKYHKSRIQLILKTWYLLAREQIYFFTDTEDKEMKEALRDHVVNTNCSTDHSRQALSCKMAVEFDYYMASRKRWFCHMDDDIYLNVPRLLKLLQQYDHRSDWYLGKPSLKHPLEIEDRKHPGMKLAFWFATGGAGFCISRSLALKMAPHASGGRFMTTAETIRLPDDCTVGYIIEHLLQKQLTVVPQFHSHLEALRLLKPSQLSEQITVSFSEYPGKANVVEVPGFSSAEDPTRFRSLHCFLFPTFRECRQLS
ncbi:beta-1,3-N-acetylglucosaminyltransferase manic fringe [Aplysia californica]|uniref:Beta-1,3-N-acetylglucosaminyltransferase manic fringe n=1 Tax=Aplysia californica TaxID=6500 RepID=A0ABM0JG92_APLCA|nr:beta-1,3-N-acetylglucosaminyltransferase manic fringe [Aplysia californica]